MDREKVRREIEKILLLDNPSSRTDGTMVDEIMKVVEREARTAADDSYYDAVFEHSGTMGCSMN